MKKYSKHFGIIIFILMAFNFNGCILDAFDTLVQGFPISADIDISSSDTFMEETENFNLDENNFYNENKSKIKDLKLVKIAYRTVSVSPASLSGNIIVTLKQANGTTLFSKTLTNAKPVDYITSPYELELTQSEIQLVNSYLALLTNRAFQATVRVENLPGGDKTLNASIDIVFEMEYEL